MISWLGNRVVFDLRNRMFRHLQTLSVGYIDRRGVGSIMSRIQNDVGVINEFFGEGITGVFGNVLILVGIVVVMLWTNWQLALLAFVVLPVMVADHAGLAASGRSRPTGRRGGRSRSSTPTWPRASPGCGSPRRSPASRSTSRHFDRLNRDNLDAAVDAARLSSLLFPIVSLVGAVATATGGLRRRAAGAASRR